MKVKLIKFPIAAVNDDLTLDEDYDVLLDRTACCGLYEIIDDAGDGHEVEEECVEVVEENASKGNWYKNGELPPVGTECYYQSKILSTVSKGVIGYHVKNSTDKLAIIEYDPCGFDVGVVGDFKPIKSETQKEFEKDLLESVNKNGVDFCHKEWEIAEHMIAQGWRKG